MGSITLKGRIQKKENKQNKIAQNKNPIMIRIKKKAHTGHVPLEIRGPRGTEQLHKAAHRKQTMGGDRPR